MKKSIVWTVIGLLAVIGLTACGGGGGGDAPPATTPPGTLVNLNQVKNFAEATTPGSTMSFTLAGSSSAGPTNRAISMAISAPTTTSTPTGTQTLNVLVRNTTLTNTSTGASVSTTSTYYLSNWLYVQEIYDDGTISTPISQTLLPSSAKVGDFGSDMVVSNSDGSTETRHGE